MNQSYRNFKCIVVDNGSDDNSAALIVDAIDKHSQFEFLQLPGNLGQLGGALWALGRSRGEFVTFLDSDDVLFPEYLACHLQAHIAAEAPVGFTSSNCVDVNADGVLLTGGNYNMYRCWLQGMPALLTKERAVRLKGVEEGAYQALADSARSLPAQFPHWCWCPGSSNMIRRVLLDCLSPSEHPTALSGGVDAFYLPILHALSGTILISRPLSAYRIHGKNDYSALPSLRGMPRSLSRTAGRPGPSHLRVTIWLIDRLDEIMMLTGSDRYWEVFSTATGLWSQPRLTYSHSEFRAILARRYKQLVSHFGEARVYRELRRKILFSEYLGVVRAANAGRFPLAEVCRALFREVLRKGGLLRRKLHPNRSWEAV